MQPVTVVAVGRLAGFYADGVAEYSKRLCGLCRFKMAEVAEEPLNEKNSHRAGVNAALKREGDRILAAVPKGAALVALCIEGSPHSSERFAEWLALRAGGGSPSVAFAVGSSHGLGQPVKDAAAFKLSLGPMTLPHQLARLVLCEQLYRALMIQNNSRYHK
jgi:23S rRNA (pseudouridine1915-N3)-methyltransferase